MRAHDHRCCCFLWRSAAAVGCGRLRHGDFWGIKNIKRRGKIHEEEDEKLTKHMEENEKAQPQSRRKLRLQRGNTICGG